MTEKRCIVHFQPQAWINDYAVGIDGDMEIDVTERVLAMGRKAALEVEDHSYEADDLVAGLHDHNGPFSVSCEDAICEFFGVGYDPFDGCDDDEGDD